MHIILNITAHTAHKTCLQAAVSLLWQKQTCIFTAIKTDCSSASIGFSNVRCVNFRLQSLLQITIKKHQSTYNHVHTACFGWDKKLSYRRETARQLPTWRGLSLPVHSSSPSGHTYAYTVESETRNKRTSSLPSVKRTLSWIGHSRSFKVILICADRNPEQCTVVMSN